LDFHYTLLMSSQIEPRISKWPFFVADGILVACAYFIYSHSQLPMNLWQMSLASLCAAAGALVSVTPFLMEYQAMVKLAEVGALTTVVTQIQNLEQVSERIAGATGSWQTAQDAADKTMGAVREIAERMSEEAMAFKEFMHRANDTEKNTLKLEVDKMRRGESEWLQVLVRMLDHVYALHLGALRSSQPNLIAQVGNFQNACRDAARRVGLVPFTPGDSEPFDKERHQLMENGSKAPEGALVAETVAAGYTFQGRMLRLALVRLQNGKETQQEFPEKAEVERAEARA
jgi:molecular chaperone GrpE (heat shock protein)